MIIEQRIKALGYSLEAVTPPMGNYVPAVLAGDLVFSSGATCMVDGAPKYRGVIGKDLTVEQGYDAARIAALNVLAKIKYEIGDLDRIERIVKVVGHVSTTPDFVNHAAITNGASDLLVEIFGDAGRHARLSLGASTLPAGLPLEIEVVAKLKSGLVT